MSRDVHTVSPDDTVEAAALAMRTHGVGSLPVCDGERLVGVITDRDIAMRVVAPGLPASATKVSAAMSIDPTYCGEDEDVDAVLQILGEDQIRRLPVVRDGRLVGIVSLADLRPSGDAALAETVREISSPRNELPE